MRHKNRLVINNKLINNDVFSVVRYASQSKSILTTCFVTSYDML